MTPTSGPRPVYILVLLSAGALVWPGRGTGAPASTAAGDPLRSPECREAVAALDRQEQRSAAAAASASKGFEALRAARRRAAQACLGPPDAPLPQHVATPPLRVSPVSVPPVTVPAPSPVPPAISMPSPPPTVTNCDPAGCWASDGTRLLRNGPDLVGPRGLCIVVGSVLRCP